MTNVVQQFEAVEFGLDRMEAMRVIWWAKEWGFVMSLMKYGVDDVRRRQTS